MKSIYSTLLLFLITACASPTATPTMAQTIPSTETPIAETVASFEIKSPVFQEGETIPEIYSCQGINISPPLTWSNIPDGTQSFTLIVDDPDAPGGTWIHWVLFNLPASAHELHENIPTSEQLENGGIQGVASSGRGYRGPCPPSGTHHYYFTLYAVDTLLTLDAKANKEQILVAMEGHILGKAQLIGLYSR
ncbi:MAG: YbhB/YbcL family Raf kinase inhibitor-like protein [Anaerolineales bacterium]